jgi:hypothetical protein
MTIKNAQKQATDRHAPCNPIRECYIRERGRWGCAMAFLTPLKWRTLTIGIRARLLSTKPSRAANHHASSRNSLHTQSRSLQCTLTEDQPVRPSVSFFCFTSKKRQTKERSRGALPKLSRPILLQMCRHLFPRLFTLRLRHVRKLARHVFVYGLCCLKQYSRCQG